MFRENLLLATLRAGTPCTAVWLFSGSPTVAEIIGGMGFSAVIIDREHSPGDNETTVAQLRAVRAAGDSTVIVRPSRGDTAELKLLLDLGAEGILMPNLQTAEEARRFVAGCRYPPHGVRGAHHTVSRAADWGAAAADYLGRYRDQLLLAAMIESERGVANLAEIAAVPGIDMVFLGPLDLSASIDRMGRWDDAEYLALQHTAERAALASEALLGGALVPSETADAWIARGYSFVTVGSDVGMLLAGGAALQQHPRTSEGAVHAS